MALPNVFSADTEIDPLAENELSSSVENASSGSTGSNAGFASGWT